MAQDPRPVRHSIAVLLLLGVLAGCDSLGAHVPEGELRPSAVVVVANADDDGPGSLRAAIADAFNGDVVTFAPDLAGATIDLETELVIGKSLTIVGPAGGLTISGQDAARVILVAPAVYEVVLEGLTITRGFAQNGFGGGIANLGHLTVRNGTIRDSEALAGGGIYSGPGSTLSVVSSTVAGNVAERDGGGIVGLGADVSIVNGTVSGNSATNGGGGIFLLNSLDWPASLTLSHATVAGNGAAAGGGIRASTTGAQTVTATLSNSIVAANLSSTSAGGPDISAVSTTVSSASSLIGAPEGHGIVDGIDGNLVGVAPGLVLDGFGKPVLADDGGPTPTHALTPASPALDAADAIACAAAPVGGLDQRGVVRPQGAGCDMGAYELVADAPPPPVEVTSVELAASGTVDKATGVANLAGTVTCTTPGTVALTVALEQEQKQRRVSTIVVGQTTVEVPCDGVSAWAAAVTAGNGVFVNGAATATAEAMGSGLPEATRALRLAWSR
jgi:hypothetical protein